MTDPAAPATPLHEELRALDAARSWHPYPQHPAFDLPMPIARAVGACLYDHTNKHYLDAISSGWVTLHGHAHPMIASAIAEQAHCFGQVSFATFTHEPAVRLAEQLATITPPGLTRTFFSDNGSTSVEVALKMALQFWANRGEQRKLIVAFENAYHGETFGAMAASGRGAFTAPFRDHFFKVVRLPDPTVDDGGGAVAKLGRLLERRGKNVAAVIVEPLLLGRAGMRGYDAKALRAIRQVTEQHGVLLIADEALTGFGRTGPIFACGGAEVSPDIMCLSKGLTGGFLPLGATVVREEVYAGVVGGGAGVSGGGENSVIGGSGFVGSDGGAGGSGVGAGRNGGTARAFLHGHAYAANPIACAAARASVTLLDNDSAVKRAAIEEVHRGQIAKLAAHPSVKAPRVMGTLAAFDVGGSGVAGGVGAGAASAAGLGVGLAEFALKQGVVLSPIGDVVYVLPPYCMSQRDLEDVWGVVGMWLEMRG